MVYVRAFWKWLCAAPLSLCFSFSPHVRPFIEYASCLWNTGCVEDLRKLEHIQRRWTKQVEGLRELSYSDRLTKLNLFSIQGSLLRADLIQYWKILHGKSTITSNELFTFAPNIGTRGHSMKLQVSRTQTEIRRRSFSHRQVTLWNSLLNVWQLLWALPPSRDYL